MNQLFKKADAIIVRVSSLDDGLAFYRDKLGHKLLWRNETMAALSMAESDTEFVLSTTIDAETDILVESVDAAITKLELSGGSVITGPNDIPVGKVAVVQDPFGNHLTLVDLTKGRFKTDDSGNVVAVEK